MQAQVINSFGDLSVFVSMELPKPKLKPGYVIIRVKATSVNPVDCRVRSGFYATKAPPFPAVLHGDVAGVIEEISVQVSGFKVGDEDFGCVDRLKLSNCTAAL